MVRLRASVGRGRLVGGFLAAGLLLNGPIAPARADEPAKPATQPAAEAVKPAETPAAKPAETPAAAAAETAKPAAKAPAAKVTLRYRFEEGETIRWQVEHRAEIRTTVSGSTQTAETISKSTKVWKVIKVDPSGPATFEHSVEHVDMRQLLTGRQEVRYNSDTDKVAPEGFQDAAKSVGVVLSAITLDNLGNVVKREDKNQQATATPNEGQITLPLPKDPVAVGESWSYPYNIDVPLQQGGFKKVETRQKFTLEEVDDNIATIRVVTQILTPIRDPAIEAQLIQRESNGTVQFNIETGRVVGQQTDLDRRVVGFQGDGSVLHYVTRFVETLLPPGVSTARRAAGPAAPK